MSVNNPQGMALYGKDPYAALSASGTLTVNQRFVVATGEITVTLPSVAEARDKIFTITAPAGGTDTVTVADQDDSLDWSDISLNADDDGCALFSDGRKWWVIADNYSS